jgi:hypothetical protein
MLGEVLRWSLPAGLAHLRGELKILERRKLRAERPLCLGPD